MNPNLELILQTLPQDPGVYRYFDAQGRILYVGKAKNLRKRVQSYFRQSVPGVKTRMMVSKIADVQFIVVQNEADALLLENNLIKTLRPRYNILLKDDKTYPWICIKKERFPRIFLTRRKIDDGSEYYGPYPSVSTAHLLLEMIRELFPLRTCKYDLSEKNIAEGRITPCLEYHIKRCAAPCAGYQSEEEYAGQIAMAREIIRGHFSESLAALRRGMARYAKAMEYEKAQKIKEKIARLENYQSRSTVASASVKDVDVFSIVSDSEDAYVNYLRVVRGAVVQSYTMELKKKMDEPDNELLSLAIVEIRQIFSSTSQEVLVPLPADIDLGEGIKVRMPKKGEKRALVELSEKNARQARIERLNKERIVDPEAHTRRILQTMKSDLRLPVEPHRIECFDNSNIQGTNAVSACVVFIDGKPAKKEYRHFLVRTVRGPDDFATMKEVVYRRYHRLVEEGRALPDLVIVDGGKGQLSAAYEIFKELGIAAQVSLLGIAKRLEEIFYPEDPLPLYLDKRSVTLRIIQKLRDEAHRFGIAHHRLRRSKSALASELDGIKGIGEKTRDALLTHFKSVEGIKKATEEAIALAIGAAKAKLVTAALQKSPDIDPE